MNPDMNSVKDALNLRFRYLMRPLMMKRAMIGVANRINIQTGVGKEIAGASYVLDPISRTGVAAARLWTWKGAL